MTKRRSAEREAYLNEWMQKMTFGRFFFSYRSIVSKMKLSGRPTSGDLINLRNMMMLSECRHWSFGCCRVNGKRKKERTVRIRLPRFMWQYDQSTAHLKDPIPTSRSEPFRQPRQDDPIPKLLLELDDSEEKVLLEDTLDPLESFSDVGEVLLGNDLLSGSFDGGGRET
jgi:hypothetical protein